MNVSHDVELDDSDLDLDEATIRVERDYDQPPAKKLKPPRARSRASRACDRCKSRKTRCSGKYPCIICSRLKLDCTYTAEYRRGRLPSIEMETDNNPASHEGVTVTDAHGRTSQETDAPNPVPTPQPLGEQIPSPVSTENRPLDPGKLMPETTTGQSSRHSSEPAEIDQQGHYVGPASGASFLLRIQRKLQQQRSASSSDASIFTFGDLPMPESDPRLLILPPRSEGEALVARYFEFGSATHRYLHRQTVESWLEELYETKGNMHEESSARSKMAMLFMVFAHAENFPQSSSGMVDPKISARFFSAAEDQLSAEKGAISLTSVQVRLSQCFYLLAHSRINHCWSLFGTTSHLMLALGIHRKSRVDVNSSVDFVDIECRKRTFWCAYNLDTYLSAALGRPRTFHDEDIDQEVPLCVDDHQLYRGNLKYPPAEKRQSVMSGAVAHLRLSRIVANILRDLYSIRPQPTEKLYMLAAKYTKDIEQWSSSVSYLFGTDTVDASLFQPIFLRQRNVLNLACWHAQILVHRPFLLNNFASLANLGSTKASKTRNNSKIVSKHVDMCLDAALNIVKKIDELSSRGQLYNTYWFSHYFAFSAVVMLYLFAIQQRHAQPETYVPAFRAATRCQIQIAATAIPGSLAYRYGLVLQELRLEVLRHNERLLALATGQHREAVGGEGIFLEGDDSLLRQHSAVGMMPILSNPAHFESAADGTGAQMQLGPDGNLAFPGGSPGSSIIQMTGWGQFDSLVTTGVGGLESFLSDWNYGAWTMDNGKLHG